MSLKIVQRKIHNIPVIELQGRIIGPDVKKLSKKLETFYGRGVQLFVVDLGKVAFLDSHGLGTFVYFHTLLQREKRVMLFLNTNPQKTSYVKRLFEATNLDKVFFVESTISSLMQRLEAAEKTDQPSSHEPLRIRNLLN